MRRGLALALLAAVISGSAAMAQSPTAFIVTSPAFEDGGLLTKRNGGSGDCGGDNISPPIAWRNVPQGTKSFALVMYDPDGQKGLGSVHWVAYDIPNDRRDLPEAAGTDPAVGFVGGSNSRQLKTYFGPCPPQGDALHHYVFTVYALDLAPGTLAPGLTRDELFAAIRGHILAAISIVGRYTR
jgi:Raf kinase inhibitor-like YbhB/YbcL family protein